MSGGSRWFVSKSSKEPRRDRNNASRNHDEDGRRDGYARRAGSERSSATTGSSHPSYLSSRYGSSPDRKEGGRTKIGDGHGQLVFRRQDRSKTKVKRSPDGSPHREEGVRTTTKSRNRDAKKSSEDDVWSALERAQEEPALWSLRELRERLSSHWVSKHGSQLREALEEILRRPRLPHDARSELISCLTSYGALLGEGAAQFVDWVLEVCDLSIPDESRIVLLKSLLEVLKANSQVAGEVLPRVMSRSQTVLENTDDCELLLSAAALSLWTAEQDPDSFAACQFHDTVDILVGWHIDAPSEPLARRTGQALQALAPFWVADPAFCATLLGQFLEDLEAYADDLSQEDPCECLDKMGSLLRVYGTVVHGLGSQAVQVVTWELLSDNLHGMLNCITHATEFSPRNNLLIAANRTLGLLCSLTGECPNTLVELMRVQSSLRLSENHALSLLELLGSLVSQLGPQLPLPLVSLAFGPWSLSPRPRVQGALLAVQRALLGVKSVPLLEEAYRCLAQALLAAQGNTQREAAKALVPLCALTEVANSRHSILGMWALKPGFFDLMLEHLAPIGLGSHPPSVQYALLFLLHSHCQRHGHFVSTSILVTGGDLLNVPSSGHFSRILTLITSVLAAEDMTEDSRLLALHWTEQLMEVLQALMGRLVESSEFLSLVEATINTGHSSNLEVACRSCQILQKVVETVGCSLPRGMLERCYDLSLLKVGSICQQERAKFIALMALLPVDLITNSQSTELQEQASERAAILSSPSGSPSALSAQGFRWVMKTLLQPGRGGDLELHLGRLAPASLSLKRQGGLLWLWALWESAQTCVQLKLRTALGKPQETFMSIEVALKEFLAQPPEGAAALKRAHLLLEFLEQLDKCMYNAYEGSAGSLAPPPKGVRAFFRTNRATCLEWLSRVRPRAVRVALRAGKPAEALRHAWALAAVHGPRGAPLQDLATCLIQLRCPDAIWGLYAWGKEALGKKMPWLKAAAAHAAGRFESAAEEYATLLGDELQVPKDLRSFLLNQMLDCQTSLADWGQALKWAEEARQTTMNGCINGLTTGALDVVRHMGALVSPDSLDGLCCPGDMWDAEQQLLVVQHRAMHGCASSEPLSEALLHLGALRWPPQVEPSLVALVRDVPPTVHGSFSMSLHCCSAVGAALTWSSARPGDGFLLDGARLARKQHNFSLAERWLLRESGSMESGGLGALGEDGVPLPLLRECAKLLHAAGRTGEAAASMAKVAKAEAATLVEAELVSRSLLTLAKWLQADSSAVEPYVGGVLGVPHRSPSICSVATELQWEGPQPPLGPLDGLVGPSEASVGALLERSLSICPSLPKAWATFAAWCYRWGRRVVDAPGDGKLSLVARDGADISYHLPETLTEEEVATIKRILTRVQASSEGSDWVLGTEPGMGPEGLRQELEAACPRLEPQALESLLEAQSLLLGQAYQYYKASATAYFKYLQLNHQDQESNVTATLRLLRLVVKHASELREELEEGLACTPTAPWRGIIPQLFSRLSHPEPYVRKSVRRLLSRLARDHPHLIVFPAVVGALPEPPEGVGGASLFGVGGARNPGEDSSLQAPMQEGYTALVDTLAQEDATTIAQVQLLVQELRRITLLWDELWLGALNVHSAEAHRRIRTLEEEVARLRNNHSLSPSQKESLIRDKHAVFLCPTLRVLEQLQVWVSRSPETPHEMWFRDTLGPLVGETLNTLRDPPDPWRPQASWAALRKLHLRLQRRPHDEGPQLLMERVSPKLASLKDSQVPMPGCSGSVRISAVQSSIAVLPTKTKPKKLGFQGSDGRKYTFLFKGMEDLHLDERIMQLLSICNNLLARGSGAGCTPRARHYAVTPLGSRSGLIQWLDGVTPLFALYKRWQQREAAPPLRPSELFYGKLTPLLKEQGIVNLDNRREWPLSVLVRVLEELMEETPRDLVARELWCASASAAHWWQTTRSFNRSTAVMSVIGYVIGLGDRHLDNVLLDLRSGEVVHIDYNVCFEKGKNLRVPEKVPFRMTPNIEAALGVTGVEGQFRLACEQVLKVLRRGRETLLTLLEAFVYDPLVDWDSGGGGTSPSSRLERDMASALLAIRLRETAQQWHKNGQQLDSALDRLKDCFAQWQKAQAWMQAAEHRLGEACAQQTLLEEALASEGHPLFSLPSRHREWAAARSARDAALVSLGDKLDECRRWAHLQASAAGALASGAPPDKWRNTLSASDNFPDSVACLEPLAEFLHSSGQGQLLQQCEQSEEELRLLVQQQRSCLQTIIELLGTYAAIVVQCPGAWSHEDRIHRWQLWLEGLLDHFTLAKCQEVISEFHCHYGAGTEMNFVQAAVTQHYEIQSTVADCNKRIMTVLERKQAEGADYFPEAQAGIMTLAQGSEEMCRSLRGSLLGALCSCSQNLLVMETAAAGDHPSQLWATDWFLEDLYGQGYLAQELATLLANLDPPADTLPVCGVVEAIYKVFAALLDLSVHFETIIVPEALKRAADPSVTALIGALHSLTHHQEGSDILDLLSQLHQRVTKGAQYVCIPAVKNLKDAFDKLVSVEDPAGRSLGQMLVQGLHGLFAKIGQELVNLYAALDSVDTDWNSVDVVWSARTLCPANLGSLASHSEDLVFLECLLAMQQLFCNQLQTGIEDHMFAPIKHAIASIYRTQVLGLPSLALGGALSTLLAPESCRSEPRASCTLESLSRLAPTTPEALSAVASLEASCRRSDLLRRLDQAEVVVRGRLHRAQLHMAAHHWLHEEVLPHPGGQSLPARANLLAEMRKAVQAVGALDSSLAEARESHLSLVGAVEQRLKWAGGANPALAQTRDQFGELVAHWTDALQSVEHLSAEMCSVSESLLLREALRTQTSEAHAWDAGFLALLNRCQESCMLAEQAGPLSPVEEQLLALQPPPLHKDAGTDWLRSLLDKVALGACREELEQSKADRETCREALQKQVVSLRGEVLSKHHELMSELRSLLKSLARQEDVAVQEYLSLYRGFSEQVSELVRTLLAAESPSEELAMALDSLAQLAPRVYSGLTALAGTQDGLDQQKTLSMAASVRGPEDTPDRKVTKDPRTGKALQERNGYAVGVWKRVKMKLDGRDPDSGKRSTVADQVDYTIKEATRLENLALLYEGWTPWV